jgi:cysteine desulfurase/selenocysteine lyase
VGLGAALDYVEGVGLPTIAASLKELTAHLRAVLSEIDGIEIYGSKDAALGIVSWNVSDRDAGDVAAELYQHGKIMVSAGACGSPLAVEFLGLGGLIRTSLHCFNSHDDIEGLARALYEVVRRAATHSNPEAAT